MGVVLLALLAPLDALCVTPAGTVIRHSSRASFGSSWHATSSESAITVKDLSDPALVPPRSATTPVGMPVDFSHTLTNRGNSPDRFSLRITSSANAVGGGAPCSVRILAQDGSPLVDSDGDGLPETPMIPAGGSVTLTMRVTAPTGSEGRVENFTVHAVSLFSPARSSTLTDELTVLRSAADTPVKTVSPTGAVTPGSILSYRIDFGNGGTAAASDLLLVDPLDARLEFVAGSAVPPADLSGAAVSFDGASGTLSLSAPSVPAGYSGTLTFQARVKGDATGATPIVNTARLVFGTAQQLQSNSTVTTLVPGELRISKTAATTAAEAGDIVSYSVRVENVGRAPLTQVVVLDTLPPGFRYLKGSTVVGGVTAADPRGGGRELSWDVGALAAGESRILSYRAVVSADAPTGLSVNSATATATASSGSTVAAPRATASVRVRSSLLGSKAIILGRVFWDRNGNSMPDAAESGVPGVRVYLEDGSFVITDGEGKYSFTGVSAGMHVVKLDSTTVPADLTPVPYNTAFAGVGWSQFISVPFGGPARGDFSLVEGAQRVDGAPAAAGGGLAPFSKEPVPLAPAAQRVDGAAAATGGGQAPFSKEPVPLAPAAQELASPAAQPRRLVIDPERVDLPADGRTVLPFSARLVDDQGRRIPGERLVTVSLGKGVLLEPDADPALPGHQIPMRDGAASFSVRAGLVTGQDEVVAASGGLTGRCDLYLTSQLRDFIVVGLGTLTVGGNDVSGHVEPDDGKGEGIFHEERLAFFTKGRILGKYLLTAAYDSGKERPDGIFQQIDPEKYYPVYGDATEIGYEAQTSRKIFVKIESGRSSAMVGDYRTDLSENEFTRYERALNGAKIDLEGAAGSIRAFESQTRETATRDEFPGNGTSGYFFLSVRPVLENSERVRIEVRDRYHSERVLSVVYKLRYIDYSIDYGAGTVLFKEPVPSLDRDLNPVRIVVTYQGAGGGPERYLYGGRAVLKGPQGALLGATAVVEEGSVQDTTLFGLDGGFKLGERLTLRGEGAVSDAPEKGSARAWKVDLLGRPLDDLEVGAYYRTVDENFFNSSMSTSELGTRKYGALAAYRGLADTVISGESFVQKDALGARLFGNTLGFVRRFARMQGEAGFKHIEQDKPGEDGHSDIIYAGVRAPLTASLDATLRREQLLAPSDIRQYQTKSQLQLDYRLNESTHAVLTEEYQEGSPDLKHSTLFGLDSRLSERMRLTTGYQLENGLLGSTDRANVDLDTRLYREGAFTLNARSGYQLENALSQERGQAILGLNGRYEIRKGIFLNSSLERVQRVHGAGGTGTAFTLAGEYLRDRDLKVTGRYEIKGGRGESSSLYGAGAAYRLNPDLTLLSKATLYDGDTAGGDDLRFDGYVGASLRPLSGNPWQVLTLVRYRIEDRRNLPEGENTRSVIVSAEPTYRITPRWSAQGKYAGKYSWQGAAGRRFRAYTDLVLAGVSYDLTKKWELNLYLKMMNQYDSGMRSFGAVASGGYRIYRDVVLLAGYNYARRDDRDLTGESYEGQGPFVGVKVKFDEQLFGREERTVVAMSPPPPPPPPLPAPAPLPIAAAPKRALLLAASATDEPLQLSGSAELLTLLVNGSAVRLPSTAVSLTRERLDAVELHQGRLLHPVVFRTALERPEQVARWKIAIMDASGAAVRAIDGAGAPPASIPWDGRLDGGELVKEEVYQYQLQVEDTDGSGFTTARELFGVSRSGAIRLTLAGGAFIFDSSELTPEAKRLLHQAAATIRRHPREKVVVEGHTDAIGTEEYNMELSRKRCQSALQYLLKAERIPAARLLPRWYGESRPVGDNGYSDGRRLNRRVELKGAFQEASAALPDDRYRTAPFVTINDQPVAVDAMGRFAASVAPSAGTLKVRMGDSRGRMLTTTVPVPSLLLATPSGELSIPYGESTAGFSVASGGAASGALRGKTDRGVTVVVDGQPVAVDRSGAFQTDLPLNDGENVFGVVLKNDAGCSRLLNLRVRCTPPKPAVEGRNLP